MDFKIYRPSEKGIANARKVAKALGVPFPHDNSELTPLVITSYFKDIQTALSPKFDHINIAEFSRNRLSAFADQSHDNQPYVHIDQIIDYWLLAATQLLNMRALYELNDANRREINRLMARIMMMAFDESGHYDSYDEMVDIFTDFPDALRLSHFISSSSLVFIACHELAHHELDHVGGGGGHRIELEADLLGCQLMVQVLKEDVGGKIIRPYEFPMVGVWCVLAFWDLIERATALKAKVSSRIVSKSHPFAQERWLNIKSRVDVSTEEKALIDGLTVAMNAFLEDLGLDHIR